MNKIRVYVYGAGKEYQRWNALTCEVKEQLEILGIVTTSDIGVQELDGHPVIRPAVMKNEEVDYVIIAIAAWKEIAELLVEQGIDETKIIRSSVFDRM